MRMRRFAMVILTSIRKRTFRHLDRRSRFSVLGKATASPMGGSLPSPLGLRRRERTKVETYLLLLLSCGSCIVFGCPVHGGLAQADRDI